jgi:hypothetical protein
MPNIRRITPAKKHRLVRLMLGTLRFAQPTKLLLAKPSVPINLLRRTGTNNPKLCRLA